MNRRAKLMVALAAGACWGFVPSGVAQTPAALVAPSAQPTEARARSIAGSTVKQIVERSGKGFDLTYALAKSLDTDLPSWRVAAGKGDPNGLIALGLCNYYGIGGAPNRDRGVELVQRAADAGNIDAMAILGVLIKNGDLDHAPQPQEGIKWFTRAAEKSPHPIASYQLALITARGHWMRGEMEEGNAVLANAAEGKSLNAQTELAMSYLSGWMQPMKVKEAIALLENAATAGHVGAMIHLGRTYAAGISVPSNPRQAARWINAAVATGDATALMTAAQMYERGEISPRKAPELAKPLWRQLEQSSEPLASFAVFQRNRLRYTPQDRGFDEQVVERAFDAARRGQPEAYLWVARFLLDGTTKHPADKEKARAILQAGIDTQEANCTYETGQWYRFGVEDTTDDMKALQYTVAAAGLRVPEAMTDIARRYSEGRGTPRDLKLAHLCYLAAANARDPEAMNQASLNYVYGRGVEASGKSAEFWAKNAIVDGFADGWLNLYELHRHGVDVQKNEKASMEFLLSGATRGGIECTKRLASAMIEGRVVDRDEKAGLSILQDQLRNDRKGRLRVELAGYYTGKLGVTPDYGRVVKLLQEAASMGNSDAFLMLANAYANGNYSLQPNWDQALAGYIKAISKGNAAAVEELGTNYLLGKRTERDPKRAFDLWEGLAQKRGSVDAMHVLTRAYLGEWDESMKNESEAMRWAERSLERKDTRICPVLARHFSAAGDFTKARQWIDRGIELGDADCYNELGDLYRYGRGVELNLDEAAKNYRLAFEGCSAAGAANLAWCFETGSGVAADRPESERLALLAADPLFARPAGDEQ